MAVLSYDGGAIPNNPLWGFNVANQTTNKGIQDLRDTFSNYAKVKTKDASDAALAAIMGADTRAEHAALDPDALAANSWLDPADKLAILKQYNAQEGIAKKAEQDAFLKDFYGKLTREELAQYETDREATDALINGLDPTLFNLAEKQKLDEEVASLYGKEFGLTDSQRTDTEILAAEDEQLIKNEADALMTGMENLLVSKGFSKDLLNARKQANKEEGAFSVTDLVKEITPRFGSHANGDNIEKIMKQGAAAGYQFNAQDIKNIYERGGENDWGFVGEDAPMDFHYSTIFGKDGKQATADYIEELKLFENAEIGKAYTNMLARMDSAKKQIAANARTSQEKGFRDMNRGVSKQRVGATDTGSINEYLRKYLKYNDFEKTIAALKGAY